MIGYFFTTVTHGHDALQKGQEIARRLMGAAAHADGFVASPAFADVGPIDAGTREISILAPLPDEALAGAVVMSPVRYFRDAYGGAFLTHIHNAVREGGWIAVPFHSDAAAERTGFWSLPWLIELFGEPSQVDRSGRMALFTRRDFLYPPRSVLSFVMRDGYGIAVDFLKDRAVASTPSYIECCGDFLVPPLKPLVGRDETFAKFLANLNYSVTGTGYKTEGLRRLIAAHVPSRDDIRVLDIGGGAGFVDVELLLTTDAVSRVVNCEPIADNLPLNRRLYRWFEPWIGKRYKLSLCPVQDYPFDESFDVICAFASLLYVPRERIESTLRKAWAALRPGGILAIHENIKRACFEDKDYYPLM
ncbi:MAG: class I SAM-dependent methyltransferase, partial [Variovorax sp.]